MKHIVTLEKGKPVDYIKFEDVLRILDELEILINPIMNNKIQKGIWINKNDFKKMLEQNEKPE